MKLDRQQENLLMFFETCMVDHVGNVSGEHMNEADFKQARQWTKDSFLEFRRYKMAQIRQKSATTSRATTHWVTLGDEAWTLAHKARRERSDRMQAAKEQT